MNTARQVAYVNPQSYLDVSNGSMIQISDTSSLSLLQAYPKWILYTSLGLYNMGRLVLGFDMVYKVVLLFHRTNQ